MMQSAYSMTRHLANALHTQPCLPLNRSNPPLNQENPDYLRLKRNHECDSSAIMPPEKRLYQGGSITQVSSLSSEPSSDDACVAPSSQDEVPMTQAFRARQFPVQLESDEEELATAFSEPSTPGSDIHDDLLESETIDLSYDPRDCPEYSDRIMRHLRELELHRRPRQGYMSRQRDINVNMRALLIDWQVDVVEEFELARETLFLTVNLLDRFLSLMHVTRGRLQLVGVACMLVAAKLEEIHVPQVAEFVYICDNTYTAAEVTMMEFQILQTLRFDVTGASIFTFGQQFLKFIRADDRTMFLSHYLMELSLLEYSQLNFVSSEIAAAAIVLALHTLRKPHWNQAMASFFQYSLEDLLDECLPQLFTAFRDAKTKATRAVYDRYSRLMFDCVARLSPLGTPDNILA